jgi:predicted nucleic acid-binding protein
MIVVDCSVLADFWAGEASQRRAAHRLLAMDEEWVSVGLWRFELGNVLLKYVRAGRLAETEMRQALLESWGLISETVDEIDMEAVWLIASEKKLTYYDSAYVWLAKSRKVPLYTSDSQVLRDCPEVAVAMPDSF